MVLPDAVVEAARAGEVATVAQWLKAGGDANERETTGKTLLHCIASDSLRSDEVERGRCDIARLLLARGAEADAKRVHPVFLSAFARLIGSAPASRPRTRAAAKIRTSPGLPDPVAHLVCKFWLGSPPRQANRAATRASE